MLKNMNYKHIVYFVNCNIKTKLRSFFNAFVDFIPNPACNLQLIDTKYNFSNGLAKAAAKQFISDLKQHDQLIKVCFIYIYIYIDLYEN